MRPNSTTAGQSKTAGITLQQDFFLSKSSFTCMFSKSLSNLLKRCAKTNWTVPSTEAVPDEP